MARTVNYNRKTHRPHDPDGLHFDLNLNEIGADFVKGDVWVGEKRHIIFATDYQLQLLGDARQWLVATIYLYKIARYMYIITTNHVLSFFSPIFSGMLMEHSSW